MSRGLNRRTTIRPIRLEDLGLGDAHVASDWASFFTLAVEIVEIESCAGKAYIERGRSTVPSEGRVIPKRTPK